MKKSIITLVFASRCPEKTSAKYGLHRLSESIFNPSSGSIRILGLD